LTRMKYTKTGRGFASITFKDRYDIDCSVQESSLATEAAIWFGCDKADPRIMNPDGPGWIPAPLPEGAVCNTRMHLGQEAVKKLLPVLTYFAKTGYLPASKKELDEFNKTMKEKR